MPSDFGLDDRDICPLYGAIPWNLIDDELECIPQLVGGHPHQDHTENEGALRNSSITCSARKVKLDNFLFSIKKIKFSKEVAKQVKFVYITHVVI